MSANPDKVEKCQECGKTVYPTERLAADERVYHKACFRCKQCNGVLKLGSFASMQAEVFCKPCFKKNFFSKGNYSEGFGKLKPQQEHDLKTGRVTDAFGRDVKDSPTGSPSSPRGRAGTAPPVPVARDVEEPTAAEVEAAEKAAEAEDVSVAAPPPVVVVSAAPTVVVSTPVNVVAPVPAAHSPSASPTASPRITPARPASGTFTAGNAVNPVQTKCTACSKTVYNMEGVWADEKPFHKSCWRCAKCTGILKLGSFASMEGIFYCKPCFKKNFFSKGNYSEGFGKLKPQQEHDLKNGRVTDALGRTFDVTAEADDAAEETAALVVEAEVEA